MLLVLVPLWRDQGVLCMFKIAMRYLVLRSCLSPTLWSLCVHICMWCARGLRQYWSRWWQAWIQWNWEFLVTVEHTRLLDMEFRLVYSALLSTLTLRARYWAYDFNIADCWYNTILPPLVLNAILSPSFCPPRWSWTFTKTLMLYTTWTTASTDKKKPWRSSRGSLAYSAGSVFESCGRVWQSRL